MARRRAVRDVYADPAEVQEFARDLRSTFLHCRELQHSWRPFGARWDDEHNNYVRVVRCTRCHTRKHQRLSLSGAVLASHYEYPDGYLHAHLGRIVGEGRDVLRLESLTREMGKPNLKAVN